MKNLKWCFLWLCFLPFMAFSQIQAKPKKIDLNEKLPIDKKVKIGKLDNGLTYYIRENRKPEKKAEFQLVVNAGSVLEDEDQLGLAHFVEHMAFNGTKHFKGNEMIGTLEKHGVIFGRNINAATGTNETFYYLTMPTDTEEAIDLGFKVLDGWAFGLLFDGKEIDKERGVIIEEWRSKLGAAERLNKATLPEILKGSRYAQRLPIGTYEILTTFKYETLKRFYTDWYRPDMMAIVLVGDFDAGKMEQKIKEYFSAYPKKQNPRERPAYGIEDNEEPIISIATDKEFPALMTSFYWKHKTQPTITFGNYRANKIVNNLVSVMLQTRIAELTEKADCPFISCSMGYGGREDLMQMLTRSISSLSGNIVSKENQIEASLKLALQELYRVKQHGFLETELERQKEEFLASYEKRANEVGKLESGYYRDMYRQNFLVGAPIMGEKEEFGYVKNLLDGITLEEVNSIIPSLVTDANFVLRILAPEKPNVKVPTKKDIQKILEEAKTLKTEPYVDNYKPEPLLDKELKAGKVTSKKENKEFGYTEYVLSNGVRVVLKPTDLANDQILMSSFSPGGTSISTDEQFFNASFASTNIGGSGVGKFDKTQLAKRLKGKTVAVSPYINDLKEGLAAVSATKDMETMFQLIYLYFTEPRKDQESFDKFISQMKTQMKFIGANPKLEFVKAVYELSYPGIKRNMMDLTLPTDEILNSLSLDKMYEIYKDRFADASDFTFCFVGNFDTDSIMPLIETYLGSLPALNRKENWVNHESKFTTVTAQKVIEKGQEDQGQLAIAAAGIFDWDKDRTATALLSSTLSITAIEIIREKLGGTYSPRISIEYEKFPTPEYKLNVSYTCEPKNAEKLKKETFKIFNQYMKKGPSKENLAKAKEQLISQRATAMGQNKYWMVALQNKDWYGTELQTLEQYKAEVNAIKIEDIKAVAQKYLKTDVYVSVILKPEKK